MLNDQDKLRMALGLLEDIELDNKDNHYMQMLNDAKGTVEALKEY